MKTGVQCCGWYGDIHSVLTVCLSVCLSDLIWSISVIAYTAAHMLLINTSLGNCLTIYNLYQRYIICYGMFTIANFGLWDKERPQIPQRNTVATLRVLRHICVTFRAVNWRLCSHHRCQSHRIASERACVCWGTVCHNNMFTLRGRKIYRASTENRLVSWKICDCWVFFYGVR